MAKASDDSGPNCDRDSVGLSKEQIPQTLWKQYIRVLSLQRLGWMDSLAPGGSPVSTCPLLQSISNAIIRHIWFMQTRLRPSPAPDSAVASQVCGVNAEKGLGPP